MFKNPPLLLLLYFLIFSSGASNFGLSTAAAAEAALRKNEANYIFLQPPLKIYKALKLGDIPQNPAATEEKSKRIQIEFSLAKVKPLGGTRSDIGWLCLDSTENCAKIPGTQNYWIDEASDEIKVGSQTESVHKRRIGKWVAFEAFPLCGWTSESIGFNPAGGQCYSVVLSGKEKTISFNILLGQNKGCKDIEMCWKIQLNQLRQMLGSAH